MPIHQVGGMGWLPDLPDRRDRMFGKQVLQMSQGAKQQPIGESPVQSAPARGKQPTEMRPSPKLTHEGWELSAKRSADLITRDRTGQVRRRLLRALSSAFNDTKRPSILLATPPSPENLPDRIDLRPFMSPVEDQGDIGSCTAHAVIGLVEYLQIVTDGHYVDASRLFLYKATRDLLQWQGDTGAFIRETIKAMALFGVCPESYLPYDTVQFDVEPSPFCFAFGGNYKAISYYRLQSLDDIRSSIAQGYPVAFGFTCYESIDNPAVAQTGIIPYPVPSERSVGGHAVLAVGYVDDPDWYHEGVLIIRNSWGEQWGQEGYGFLPYSYVVGNNEDGSPAADDFWTMTHMGFPDLTDTHAPPYEMGLSPKTSGGLTGPPLVYPQAFRRPAARPRRSYRSGNPVFGQVFGDDGGGNPTFGMAGQSLTSGNPVFGSGNPVFASLQRYRDAAVRPLAKPITASEYVDLLETLGGRETQSRKSQKGSSKKPK